MKKIVLKLGGSILTKKFVESFPLKIEEIRKDASFYIRSHNIRQLIPQITSALKQTKLTIVLGVGPFGHYLVQNIKKLEKIETVHESVYCLSSIVVNSFRNSGLNVELFDPFETCSYIGDNSFDLDGLWEMIQNSLKGGNIPVTYGDIVSASGTKGKYGNYEILSGDRQCLEFAMKWKADKIIMVMDEDGLYDKYPKLHEDAKLIRIVRPNQKLNIIDEGIGADATGRIKSKMEILQIAAKNGITGQLINGLKKDCLKNALMSDEIIGTLVLT